MMKESIQRSNCFVYARLLLQLYVFAILATTKIVLAENVVVEKIVAFPEVGKSDIVVLRNLGTSQADLRGWYITDSSEGSEPFHFGDNLFCDQYETILPGGRMVIRPHSRNNQCGFKFNLSIRDSIMLFNDQGTLVDSLQWKSSTSGIALRRLQDGSYIEISENENIVSKLELLGNYNIFLRALEVTGVYDLLQAPSDPSYIGPAEVRSASNVFIPKFPRTFGWFVPRQMPSPSTEEPLFDRPDGIPKQGPYTILAPHDSAVRDAIERLGGGEPFSVLDFLSLPELRNIILYHILPGFWTTETFRTGEPMYTSRSAEVVPFRDGSLYLSDTCVDKPTPDLYSCQEQKSFGKCSDPFMTDEVAANWPGGFCQRTCEHCTCGSKDSTSCAQILLPDIVADNGVVHVVNRLLFPPPVFHDQGNSSDEQFKD